ncbi:MAG: hypothetical protein ACO3LE_00070 [Bdellovibrionota bacterium]
MLLSTALSLLLLGSTVEWQLISNERPVSNQEVVLVNSRAEGMGRGKTNAKGVVRFEVDAETNPFVFAGTVYEDVAYLSPAVSTKSKPTQPHRFEVYPSTLSKESLEIFDASIYFEVRGKDLIVHQSFWVKNSSGSSVRSAENDAVFSFMVPNSAFDFRYGEGFQRGEVENQGNSVLIKRPLYPGDSYFSFQYSVDSPRWSLELAQSFSLPVRNLSLLSNSSNIRFNDPKIESSFEKFYAGELRRVYLSKPDSSEFTVQLSGLPLNIPWTWWFPLALSIALLFSLLIPQNESKRTEASKDFKDLIEEWTYLHRLYESSSLDEKTYRLRKLDLVEQLLPFFDKDFYETHKSSLQEKSV